jgi:hypothetical protein
MSVRHRVVVWCGVGSSLTAYAREEIDSCRPGRTSAGAIKSGLKTKPPHPSLQKINIALRG